MKRTRLAAVIGTVAITAAGLAALAGCGTTAKATAAPATPAGSCRYLCPVPGHAQEGMTGAFTVSGT
jgi:hypothetical protein